MRMPSRFLRTSSPLRAITVPALAIVLAVVAAPGPAAQGQRGGGAGRGGAAAGGGQAGDPAQAGGGRGGGGRGLQQPRRDNPNASTVGTGRISGNVILDGSGTPVRRARVTLSGTELRGARTTVSDETGRLPSPLCPLAGSR